MVFFWIHEKESPSGLILSTSDVQVYRHLIFFLSTSDRLVGCISDFWYVHVPLCGTSLLLSLWHGIYFYKSFDQKHDKEWDIRVLVFDTTNAIEFVTKSKLMQSVDIWYLLDIRVINSTVTFISTDIHRRFQGWYHFVDRVGVLWQIDNAGNELRERSDVVYMDCTT